MKERPEEPKTRGEQAAIYHMLMTDHDVFWSIGNDGVTTVAFCRGLDGRLCTWTYCDLTFAEMFK